MEVLSISLFYNGIINFQKQTSPLCNNHFVNDLLSKLLKFRCNLQKLSSRFVFLSNAFDFQVNGTSTPNMHITSVKTSLEDNCRQ